MLFMILVHSLVSWQNVFYNKLQNNPKLAKCSRNFQMLVANTKSPLRSIPDADILEEARVQIQELLDQK